MKYFVSWSPEAISQLAAAWLLAPDKNAVNWAETRVDARLAADPHGHGEARSEGLYAINELPLGVLYEIWDADARVSVVSVIWLP